MTIMTDAQAPDGPPTKRAKMGGGVTQRSTDNGDFNMGGMNNISDYNSAPMIGGPNTQQHDIASQNQHLSALLSSNPSDPHNQTNMMYSGPGPGHQGHPAARPQYRGPGAPHMMGPGTGIPNSTYMSNTPINTGHSYGNNPGYANSSMPSYSSQTGYSSVPNSMYNTANPPSAQYTMSNNINQHQMNSQMEPMNQNQSMMMNSGPPSHPLVNRQMPNNQGVPSGGLSQQSGPAQPTNQMVPSNNQQTQNMTHVQNGPTMQSSRPPMPGSAGTNMHNSQNVRPQGQPNSGSQLPGSQPGSGQTGIASADPKRKLIQQQLVLLLHAHKCQRRERNNGEVGNNDLVCTLEHCRTMKSVLRHMTSCSDGRSCSVQHCSTSRQIIQHWRNCQRNDCPVCLPLKTAKNENGGFFSSVTGNNTSASGPLPNQQVNQQVNGTIDSQYTSHTGQQIHDRQINNQQYQPNSIQSNDNMPPPQTPTWLQESGAPRQVNAGSLPASGGFQQPNHEEMKQTYKVLDLGDYNTSNKGMTPNNSMQTVLAYSAGSQSIKSMSSQSSKPWHENVAVDLRNHLVYKLVQAIFPSPQPEVLSDPRMNNLIQYARKVEMDMYKAANSREEYYHMLAEKIYKIQKELQQKRDQRRMEAARQQQPNSHASQNFPDPPSNRTTGPASQHSVGGPPSVGNLNSLLSPPMNTTNNVSSVASSGVPVSVAFMQSKSDLQQLLNKEEVKSSEIKLEPQIPTPTTQSQSTDNISTTIAPTERKEECGQTYVKDEPATPGAPHTPKTEQKPDVKDSKPATPRSDVKIQKKAFNADELRMALLPVLLKILELEESIPFRVPVDPVALNIPDYFTIIKQPMDLSKIKTKLDNGEYETPWDYCDDVHLMMDNAWLYNRRTSKVYKCCSKIAEVFEQEINPVMKSLGFCCGMKKVFYPQNLCCFGKQLCTINRDQIYYSYENRFMFCEKCFDEIRTDLVEVNDDISGQTHKIEREKFLKTKNDIVELEKFVICTDCKRKFHSICVGHYEPIWPNGYTCDNCYKIKGSKKKENRYTARRLPTTKLSNFLENRVNSFLRSKSVHTAGYVIIRVLASSDKETEIKQGMRERFPELPATYPYRCKAMFAFEERDGKEVCFFGMHVQEYDANAPQPNTGRVYISYLDSVRFFQPREYRTAVYHEILIGYLDYCKQLGFQWGHIWACPPSEGDDYIFHCHPTEQKIPKPKRLQEWYKKMLDKAIVERAVAEYTDVYKDAMNKNMKSATEVPYFDGDYWPNVLEESIRESEAEEQERRKKEEEAAAFADPEEGDCSMEAEEVGADGQSSVERKHGKNKNLKKKGNKKANSRKSNKKSGGQNALDLLSKIKNTMEKFKDVFFVIRLQHSLEPPKPITDPDPLISCDLMDGRDAFLTMAREKHWEFSSLRRTTFSTLAMLHEIHTSGRDFVYTCNNCKTQMETGYHCKKCDDFDLCIPCYKNGDHPHPMEKLSGMDLGGDSGEPGQEKSSAESRRLGIQNCIQNLVHACQCRDANCRLPECKQMKKVVAHSKQCQETHPNSHKCSICKKMLTICMYHAKVCNESKCPVPYCQNIKQKLKQQQMNARKHQARLLQRRLRNMQNHNGSSTTSSNNGSSTNNRQTNNTSGSVGAVPSPYTSTGGDKPGPGPPAPPRAKLAAEQALFNASQKSAQSNTMHHQQQTMPLSHPSITSSAHPSPMPGHPGSAGLSQPGMVRSNFAPSGPGLPPSYRLTGPSGDAWGGQGGPPPVYSSGGQTPQNQPPSMVSGGMQQMAGNSMSHPSPSNMTSRQYQKSAQDVSYSNLYKDKPHLVAAYIKKCNEQNSQRPVNSNISAVPPGSHQAARGSYPSITSRGMIRPQYSDIMGAHAPVPGGHQQLFGNYPSVQHRMTSGSMMSAGPVQYPPRYAHDHNMIPGALNRSNSQGGMLSGHQQMLHQVRSPPLTRSPQPTPSPRHSQSPHIINDMYGSSAVHPGQPHPSQPQPGIPGQLQPGIPGQPQPGIPGQPQPGIPGQPQPGIPGQPQSQYTIPQPAQSQDSASQYPNLTHQIQQPPDSTIQDTSTASQHNNDETLSRFVDNL